MNAAERLLGAAALARHGERIALTCANESVSYARLAEQVRRSASAFSALGARTGDRILILMRDTPESAAAWLGAVRGGFVAVALNTRLSEAEYRHVLRDSDPRLALVEDVFVEANRGLAAELAAQGRLVVAGGGAGALSWFDCLSRSAQSIEAPELPEDHPAFWLYSSGTTGPPKGVVHTHRSLQFVGQVFRELGIGEGDRVLTTSKLFFAYGLEHGLLAPLALGAASRLIPEWPDPDAVLAAIRRAPPVALFSVPSFYRRLLAEPAERLAPLRAVRHFVAAGERLPVAILERWQGVLGSEIVNLYGMSETFCACMLSPPGTGSGARGAKPLALTRVRLLDEQGQEVGDGSPGVLWVQHPALARGYANRPEQTREQFRDGWFRTGDLFVRDAEGFYLHEGRSDEMVKISGQWVRPAELEEAALGESAVSEAACVPVPDSDGLERLALFVGANAGPQDAVTAALAACQRLLPRHKRPKWVRAVAELPRTATGKVQRYKLREILQRELSGKD